MKALNYGSLNIDFVYNVEHFVRSGETISSQNMAIFAGGKGLNQSVALAKSGIDTWHAGCIGEDGDYLILQNEINEISYIMERAHEKGMIIVLNPSPMDEKIRTYPLEYVDYFLLNEIEAKDLTGFDQNLADTDQHRVQEMDEVSSAWDALLEEVCSHFPNSKVVLTLGKYGSIYKDEKQKIHQPIMKVPVVDTTAAGDTFTGFFIGSIAQGLSPENAMKIAAKASAIAVSRQGAAPSIPELGEVERDMTL